MTSFLKQNLAWILVSLLSSAVLWTVVTVQQDYDVTETFYGVPVEIRNVPPGLVARGELPTVRIQVTAPLSAQQRLTPGEFKAYVDASKAGAGLQQLPIKIETEATMARIDEIDPPKGALHMEVLKKKDVPIKLSLVGNVPFGYTAGQPHLTPDSVTVSGPQSLVEEVAIASVQVPLEGVKETINQTFKLTAQKSDGSEVKGVTLTPDVALVELPVEQQLGYKAVPVTPQVVGSVGLGYQIVGIIVDPTSVTVVGDPKQLDSLNYLPTQPLDVSGATKDVTAVVEAQLPPGVSLARPQSIVTRVFVSPVESSKTFQASVTAVNLAMDLQMVLNPSEVEVTASGPMPVLSTMKATDVEVIVDLIGLGPGVHQVTPRVQIPNPLRADRIAPETVTVTIERKPTVGPPVLIPRPGVPQ